MVWRKSFLLCFLKSIKKIKFNSMAKKVFPDVKIKFKLCFKKEMKQSDSAKEYEISLQPLHDFK